MTKYFSSDETSILFHGTRGGNVKVLRKQKDVRSRSHVKGLALGR